MKYKLLSGILYGAKDSAPLAKIRGSVCGPEKEITGADGAPLYTSEIKLLDAPAGHSGEVTYHKYALTAADGSCIEASPAYNPEFDPAADGWPLCHLPRADRAMLALGSAVHPHHAEHPELRSAERRRCGGGAHRAPGRDRRLGHRRPFHHVRRAGVRAVCVQPVSGAGK